MRDLPENIDNAIARLHLPVQQGRRYQAIAADAYAFALGQATRVAATRRALQEVPWVADPFAAPLWTDTQEGERMEALATDLVTDLQTLMSSSRCRPARRMAARNWASM